MLCFFMFGFAGISRDSFHKRRATGGKRKQLRKKRKFELGRPAANTKVCETILCLKCRRESIGIRLEYNGEHRQRAFHQHDDFFCVSTYLTMTIQHLTWISSTEQTLTHTSIHSLFVFRVFTTFSFVCLWFVIIRLGFNVSMMFVLVVAILNIVHFV